MADENTPADGQSTVMGISLLILVIAALPTLVSQSFGATSFGIFLTGVVTAVIFGVLNNQGHGWNALGAVQVLTLILIGVAVLPNLNVGIVPAGVAGAMTPLLTVLTFLFAVYAVWGMFSSDHRLPHLTFLFIATMVGAGAIIGIVGTVLVTLAALVTIFAWPHVRTEAPTEV